MKQSLAMALFATISLAACAQDTPKPAEAKAMPAKPAEAKAACAAPKAPPKELVKKDLEVGSGRDVKFRSAVLVHYTGWLYDPCAPDNKGAQFDTSSGKPTPFGFMVGAGRVIKGWDEGVVGMKEKDSKRLLVIPPDKAYGDRNIGDGKIPPNSTLVFEVSMVQLIAQAPEEGAVTNKKP